MFLEFLENSKATFINGCGSLRGMRNKQTKIVATISDRNCDVEFLRALRENGMDVIRLNTAHQTPEDTLKIVKNAREVSDHIALLVDIKGPEIRTTNVEEPVMYENGAQVILKKGDELSRKDTIFTSYDLSQDAPEGCFILIDDGLITLKVEKREEGILHCVVVHGGALEGRKGVNTPGVKINLPSLTEKDKMFIEFAVEHDLDFIAHSFVRKKEDVIAVQEILDKHNSKIKVISKIENKEGVDNIDEIIEHSYGIMVARGDLGIEMPAEEVPLVQKEIINKCILASKPVITATQMLESMIKSPRPTRAEVSDVANAIMDGTDAVMLSGETAKGKYALEAVQTMSRISKTVEAKKPRFKYLAMKNKANDTRALIARASISISSEAHLNSIVAPSHSGKTARLISAFRGHIPIFAPAFDKIIMRQLALSYGVRPTFIEQVSTTDELVCSCMNVLVSEHKVHEDEEVLFVGSTSDTIDHGSNFLEVNSVKNCIKNYRND